MPISIDSSASFRVMAGSCAKFLQFRAERKLQHFFALYRLCNTISTGNTSIPSCFAIRHTVDSPRPLIFRDRGRHLLPALRHAPSATTPLSAQRNNRRWLWKFQTS